MQSLESNYKAKWKKKNYKVANKKQNNKNRNIFTLQM